MGCPGLCLIGDSGVFGMFSGLQEGFLTVYSEKAVVQRWHEVRSDRSGYSSLDLNTIYFQY